MKDPLPDKFPEPPYMQILFSFDGNKPPKPLRSPGKQEYYSLFCFVKLQKVVHTSITEDKNMLYNKLCLRITSLFRDVHHKPQSNLNSTGAVPIRNEAN